MTPFFVHSHGKSWMTALCVWPAVLTPTHRCQRYSEYCASCLQAPALLGFTLLNCLISQEGRKWLSYRAANLRFIKVESCKKNPSGVSFNSAASKGKMPRSNILYNSFLLFYVWGSLSTQRLQNIGCHT